MFRTLFTTVFATLVAAAGAASAADDLTPAAEPSYYDWSGYYGGVHAGAGRADFDISRGSGSAVGTPGTTLDANDGLFGVLAGVNFQNGYFVYGLEGDVSWGNASATNPVSTLPSMDIGVIGTVRGRVGVAYNRLLIFGTLGVGIANVDGQEAGNGGVVDSNTHIGVVGGGGIEYAFTNNAIIRGEYMYGSYGSETYTIAPPAPVPHTHSIDFNTNVFRGALIWKF
jgi:outer membrane immunogenic protein